MPVRIEVLILDRQTERCARRRMNRRERWKRVDDAGRGIRIVKTNAKERDGRTEGRVLHEIVIKFGERHDVEYSPAAAHGSRMISLDCGPGKTGARRKIATSRVESGRSEPRISGEGQSKRRSG